MEREFEVKVTHTKDLLEKAVQTDKQPVLRKEMFKTLRDRMNLVDHRE